ncbi:molybdopterin-dependent oxidoreductase [Parvibacter caecicola]|uniref:Molybdopterin-containing oxidoreductase family molybdopterin binding subunit n=1 Tax=Parvibacter caecicola TaxID=747645 RepID=A0A7W5GQM5_9ACTN|nr:molybdopterin-dependent oxidoreductase [Parvibacter caecicola]MBB3171661.1 molybdopterin-containing oxidoreductase family molybdopterin binding subunit [Parvibacter caecicola]MCR2040918.1 molybdopterin-dependent oxidoreductase [Parvibacter caecicola]RNL10731.1 molybdopterin oxidoreductase [Parvibacter caecicola]
MSESQKTLSRRSFLKGTGAAAGALGLAGAAGVAATGNLLAPTNAHAESEERVAHLCHQFHCLTGCNLKCTIRDEKISIIEPSDLVKDKRHSTICLRGINEVDHIYSEDRIKVPMKRVGERGEGKFEQISWDEAIKTIADNLKEAQQKYGEGSVFIRKSTEAGIGFDFIAQLLRADSGGNWGLDRGQANGLGPAFGPWSYLPNRSAWEMKDAATIIELSHNPLESAMVWSRPLMDAKEAGAYIVCIDPRFTGTAAKSNEWLPVRPGTDAALIQGMLKAVVDNGWYDEEFVMAHTSCPYLVNRTTGKSLRSAEVMAPNPTVVGAEEVGAPLVWDTITNAPALYDNPDVVPALEGEWTVDGQPVTTEFSLIKEWLGTITLDWAAETSGIDKQVIVDLADRYANNGPAIIDIGLGGADKYTNADVLGHSTAMLVALCGQYGKKGTGYGTYCGLGANDPAATMNYWVLPEEYHYGESPVAMYDMPYTPNNIHAALTFGDAFTLEAGAAQDMLNWVKTLDFFAIIDLYFSSAVDYADIVLPACTKFECEENVKQLRDSMGHVMLANGMVQPLFESKSDLQIERLLAAQWGLEDLLPKTYEELARFSLEGAAELDPRMEGITYDALLANGGVMALPETGDDFMPDGTADFFLTPSTRIELYFEYLSDQGHALPVYEDADEAYEANPKKATYPLYFTQGKSRYRIHAYYSASEWFQEDFGPRINIAPEDAEARGIATGDDVRVFNDRGSFVATALVNRSLQPGVLFMAETTYTRYYKDGFLQNVTNSARLERGYSMFFGPQIPYNDVLVEVEKA